MTTYSYAGTNYALRVAPSKVGAWPYAAASNAPLYCMAGDCVAKDTDLGEDSLFYLGILPVGAVVQFSVIWPMTTAAFGEGIQMANAVDGELGTLTDPDLFGDVTDMQTTYTPQVIEPCPAGAYTTTLDFALREETTVIFRTGSGGELEAACGVAVKVLYTMAGRTY